ncbi:MAG: hypothetical protein PF513_00420 [Tenericutes bacterium]|nr:hypothetical protein [Mycoplasmatota bacterium]
MYNNDRRKGNEKNIKAIQLRPLIVAVFFVVMAVDTLFETKHLLDKVLSNYS